MALVDSLLTAMVRADGDALVMHVGERPIVVSGPKTIDLSTHGMNLGAMVGMLGQLLPGESLAALKEFGAVEHALPSRDADHFSVVAARSGDDIWIEIRRRREVAATVAAVSEALPPSDEGAPRDAVLEPRDEAPADAEVDMSAPTPDALAASDVSPECLPPQGQPTDASPELVARPYAEAPPEGIDVSTADVDADAAADTNADLVRASTDEDATVEDATAVSGPPPLLESEAPAALEAVEEPPLLTEAASVDVPAAVDVPAVVDESAVPAPEALAPETPAPQRPAPVEEESPRTAAPSVENVRRDSVAADPGSQEVVPMVHEEVALDPTETTPMVDIVAPAMASAVASPYHSSSVTPATPMETARHTGPPSGGPPSRPPSSAEPLTTGSAGSEHPLMPEAPVTRTVRIEVPARAASSRASGIDRLLRGADAVGASELFLVSHARPYVRVGGNVRALQDEAALQPGEIETLIADVTPEPWRDAVRRGDPAEWLIELADVGRVRCATFRDHRGPGASFHFAFLRAATADDLQLNAETRLLATEPDGLVLVTGGLGSDMSSIVSAFVDILNHQRADYVITLEPQVRVLHVNREALVSQREVGHDPARVAAALRAALREQPDVLVIEGITSGDVAQLAIEAASQDRLVIASIDAPSAPAAVHRLIELVPPDARDTARVHLSRCFRGAVAQLLLRKTTGGRIAARELMEGTRPVMRILATGDLARLNDPSEHGGTGMTPLADAIVEYVRAGLVDVREAVRKAPDADDLVTRLTAAGVDVRALERWN